MRVFWFMQVGPKPNDKCPSKWEAEDHTDIRGGENGQKRKWEEEAGGWSDVAKNQKMPAATRSWMSQE